MGSLARNVERNQHHLTREWQSTLVGSIWGCTSLRPAHPWWMWPGGHRWRQSKLRNELAMWRGLHRPTTLPWWNFRGPLLLNFRDPLLLSQAELQWYLVPFFDET
jgi:hypothetical protein